MDNKIEEALQYADSTSSIENLKPTIEELEKVKELLQQQEKKDEKGKRHVKN